MTIEQKMIDDILMCDYSEDTEIISRSMTTHTGSYRAYFSTLDEVQNKTAVTFDNNLEKVIVKLELSFYHVWTDTLSMVLFLKESNPDILLIIDYGQHDTRIYHSLYQEGRLTRETVNLFTQNEIPTTARAQAYMDFVEQLEKHNIEYSWVDLTKEYIVANKIYLPHHYTLGLSQPFLKRLSEKSIEVNVLNKNLKKDKKIYLSRKHMKLSDKKAQETNGSQRFPSIINNFFKYHNDRVDDEEAVENFLRNEFGFEIIYPEIMFDKGMSEQINYMNQVKIVASLTSSSLSNLTYMNSDATIIEFTAPLNTEGYETYHTQYQEMAQFLNQDYISVPHNRSADDIINSIKNNKYLLKVLGS